MSNTNLVILDKSTNRELLAENINDNIILLNQPIDKNVSKEILEINTNKGLKTKKNNDLVKETFINIKAVSAINNNQNDSNYLIKSDQRHLINEHFNLSADAPYINGNECEENKSNLMKLKENRDLNNHNEKNLNSEVSSFYWCTNSEAELKQKK